MWFDCTKMKVAYNNSLRRFMGLPWNNSASEMFVNLNIKSFGELLWVFVHGFRSRTIISRNCMLASICNSSCLVFIQSYGLGGEHYCMFICDRPHTYIL